MLRFGILTVSDRSAQGIRADASGPALKEAIQAQNWTVTHQLVVPDEMAEIMNALIRWCDSENIDIILTTGGTGFAPRDVTPEATRAVIERLAPGLTEAMLIESLKITPHAMLSRAVAGIRGTTLIINLPGSPKAAIENFQIVLRVLPHAIDLIQNRASAETGHHLSPSKKQG
ncbi:MAG TPA: MogA/MoaB family molybdenum cofactor biosynthesis protein [Anaerolineales bacterium]|nr:MogA/MoaB family molybdenum cofactor biosynthesis protein [Anaerolineales bacterium]